MYKQTKVPNLDPIIYQGGAILWNWLGYCFPAGELVLMADGSLKSIDNVHIGDRVYSSDGKSINTVINVMSRDSDTIELKLYGAEVTTTPEHPLYAAKNKNSRYSGHQAKYGAPDWAEAKDLAKGDLVRSPHIAAENDSGLTDDELRYYGYYLADGHLSEGKVIESRPDRSNIGREYISTKILVCGGDKKRDFVDSLDVSQRYFIRDGLHNWQLRTRDHPQLVDLIKSSGKGGGDKQILLQFTPREYRLIIEGYLRGDGSATQSTVGGNVSYRAATISKKLAYSIAIAARTSGYYVGLRSKKQAPTGTVMGRTVNLSPHLFTLSINTDKPPNATKYLIDDEEYITVKRVGESGRQAVYNLTTDGDHTFVLNGLSVHNCLAYVQTAFGAGWAGATAWDSWLDGKVKHENRNFPIGVYIPIYFSHWGTYGGVYKNWGHVAILYIYPDGSAKIWSSPLSNKAYADVFTSITALEKAFNAKYVGWKEHVGPTRVLEYMPPVSDTEVQKAYREILERPADAEGLKHYRNQIAKGWTITQIRNDLLTSTERKTLLANKEAARKAADEAARKAAEARRAAEVAKAKAEREAAEKAAKEALEAEREAERLRLEEERKKNEQAEIINQPEPVETEPPKNEIDVEVIETHEEEAEVKVINRDTKEFKDGVASGGKFIARFTTQYAFAATIVNGTYSLIRDQIDYLVLTSNQIGTITLVVFAGLVIYNQIGYYVNEHPEVKNTRLAKLFKKWVF